MKSMKLAVLALSLLTLSATAASAQSASGNWQFTFSDSFLKTSNFDAATQASGAASGTVFLSDEQPIYYQDVDGTGEPTDKYNGFSLKADVDSLVVVNNRAVMSATIRDATIPSLIGQRLLLTADDGETTKTPDGLTWGSYKFVERTWTPSDAELKEDPGVGLTWWATDYERKDDRGYQMPIKEQPANTSTFPVATYDNVDVQRASGDIVVKP
ncbi:MAG TPA: hypothetical protein VJ866_21160 [Pyrinomonadaceae bacterium]|nr:hypothetical protein [Pyrinomonadaceae bacterium]